MNKALRKRQTGAPIGNTNAMKNGSRVVRLIAGELPKRLVRIQRYVRQYRRTLEEACVETHGEVTATAAHLIDAAIAHEQHSMICRWLLREKLSRMSVSDIITCSKELSRAKDARNKAVAQLKLDPDREHQVLATLYSKPDEADHDD